MFEKTTVANISFFLPHQSQNNLQLTFSILSLKFQAWPQLNFKTTETCSLRKILENNSGWQEWNFNILFLIIFPVQNVLYIFGLHLKAITITNSRLQQDPDWEWQPPCNDNLITRHNQRSVECIWSNCSICFLGNTLYNTT